jgi:hypothetical protein
MTEPTQPPTGGGSGTDGGIPHGEGPALADSTTDVESPQMLLAGGEGGIPHGETPTT